ncbi:MAG: VOC family protein, partial [Xanthobacteraceae bacterium]
VGSALWLFYFTVADLDQALERVAEGGGQVLEGPTEVPGERWAAHCTDPQGVVFALVGKRSRDTGRDARIIEATWSSQWAGLSLKGKLRIRKRS